MKCSRVRDKLMDYTSAELPPSEFQQMNEHLMTCESCRGELELARRASSVLDALSAEQPTPSLVSAVRGKIESDQAARRPALVPRLAMGFSAAALIGLIVTGWLRYGSVDRGVITTVRPGNDRVEQVRPTAGVKQPPATVVHTDTKQPALVATNDMQPRTVSAVRLGARPAKRIAPPTRIIGAGVRPIIVPESDSEPVILFAMQPKEPEIYVTHLAADEGGSPTELTVVREFDEGGNITSVTIDGTPSAGDSGEVVPASDTTHLIDVPPAGNREAGHPDAGGINRYV